MSGTLTLDDVLEVGRLPDPVKTPLFVPVIPAYSISSCSESQSPVA